MGTPLYGVTADRFPVVDRYRSHIHEGVKDLLPKAIGQIAVNGRDFLVEEIDFGRVVGETICVATGPGDEIVYAKRPKRFGPTRFVKNRRPEPTTKMVVILKKGDDGLYILITAFFGGKAEPEPWDRHATAASEQFWSSHALVWGSEEVVENTTRKEAA